MWFIFWVSLIALVAITITTMAESRAVRACFFIITLLSVCILSGDAFRARKDGHWKSEISPGIYADIVFVEFVGDNVYVVIREGRGEANTPSERMELVPYKFPLGALGIHEKDPQVLEVEPTPSGTLYHLKHPQ